MALCTTGFQDRRRSPLGYLSMCDVIKAKEDVTPLLPLVLLPPGQYYHPIFLVLQLRLLCS